MGIVVLVVPFRFVPGVAPEVERLGAVYCSRDMVGDDEGVVVCEWGRLWVDVVVVRLVVVVCLER